MTAAETVLFALLALEVLLRVLLEVREARALGGKPDRFAVFRVVPIVNDIFPAEANPVRRKSGGAFEAAHERAHKKEHHKIVRVLFLCGCGLFCALALVAAGEELRFNLFERLVLFHLMLSVSRIFFHFVCFAEEYEADAIAVRKVQKGVARRALEILAAEEFPRTPLFALVYRKHPTAAMRIEKVLGKHS